MDLNHRNTRNRTRKTAQRHTSQSTADYRMTKMREVQMAGQRIRAEYSSYSFTVKRR